MRYPLLLVLLFWYVPNHQAQTTLKCGTHSIEQELTISNPIYANDQTVYELTYRQKLNKPTSQNKPIDAPFLFPVAIHILHNCSTVGTLQNPSDTKIKEVLTRTTERFRHNYTNAPTFENSLYGVDTEIEFCLASVDPNGEFTTGILRYNDAEYAQGNVSELSSHFSENLIWNPNQYLNIFIVSDTDVAGVYLGGSERDFIIIHSSFLWDGLLAHELGHYFSLKHIFSNEIDQLCASNANCLLQGDFVCDTPPKSMAGKNGGTCELPANSCSTDEDDLSDNNPYRPVNMGGLGDQPDMLSNYMDYTGDCWSAFTQGQKERMHFNIEERRMPQLANSLTTCTTTPPAIELALENIQILQDSITSNWIPTITIANNGTSVVTKIRVNFSVATLHFDNEYATKIDPNTINSLILPPIDFPSGLQELFVSIGTSDNTIDTYINNNQTCLSINFGNDASNCQPVVLTKEVIVCNNNAIVEGHVGAGIFRDTFPMSNGCDSIRVLEVIVSSARIITEVDASICEGESLDGRSAKGAYIDIFTSSTGCDSLRILNLTILPAKEETLTVSICNGENFEGHTTTGTYVDSLISYSGCDSIKIIKLSVEDTDNCLTTSIAEAIIDANITLYPNPAIDQLLIQSTAQEQISYTVYSITGTRMLQQSTLQSTNEVNVQNWTSGLYLIHFTTDKGHTTRKIIVK